MDAQAAVGVWRTSFGPVKIELDSARPGSLMGVWVYQRNGREVIGYFGGPLRGNVLNFTWQEPTDGGAPLTGSGWLAFDVQGQRFSGRWWSTQGDRQGDWTGWRAEQGGQPDQPGYGGDAYGGHEYGGDAYGGHEYGGHEYGGQEPGGHDDGSQPPAHGGHNGGEAQPPSAPPGPPPPPRVHRNSI